MNLKLSKGIFPVTRYLNVTKEPSPCHISESGTVIPEPSSGVMNLDRKERSLGVHANLTGPGAGIGLHCTG